MDMRARKEKTPGQDFLTFGNLPTSRDCIEMGGDKGGDIIPKTTAILPFEVF